MSSGITFYFETKDQISHLECIFGSYFNKKWKKSIETPKKCEDYFKYFKYLILKEPEQKMFGIIQFKKRLSISGVKNLFANNFGIFKIDLIKKLKDL